MTIDKRLKVGRGDLQSATPYRVTPPLGTRGPAYGSEHYTPPLRVASWRAAGVEHKGADRRSKARFALQYYASFLGPRLSTRIYYKAVPP